MGLLRSGSARRCVTAAVFAVVLLLTAGAGRPIVAAQMLGAPGPPNSAPPPPPPGMPGPPPLNFDAVMSSAYSQSAFTFDRTMLAATDSFLAGSDPDTRRVLAGLNTVSVRNYRARDFARYDIGALAAIDGQLRGAGWRHLVNANAKDSANLTDVWLHFSGANITNLTVLTRTDRTMSVVNVDCTLRPLDLLHLSGHFGIPKVDSSAVMVPAH